MLLYIVFGDILTYGDNFLYALALCILNCLFVRIEQRMFKLAALTYQLLSIRHSLNNIALLAEDNSVNRLACGICSDALQMQCYGINIHTEANSGKLLAERTDKVIISSAFEY